MACSVDYFLDAIKTTDRRNYCWILDYTCTLEVSFTLNAIKSINIAFLTPIMVDIEIFGEKMVYKCALFPEKRNKNSIFAKIPSNIGPATRLLVTFRAFHGFSDMKIVHFILIGVPISPSQPSFSHPKLSEIPPNSFYSSKTVKKPSKTPENPQITRQKRLTDYFPLVKPRRKLN